MKIKYYHKMFWICYRLFGKWDKKTLHYESLVESTYKEITEIIWKKHNLKSVFEDIKSNHSNISSEEILKNLKELVDDYQRWEREVSKLSKRNIDSDLLKEYKKLGPRFLNEIKALNELTDEELNEYCELYSKQQKLHYEQINDMHAK